MVRERHLVSVSRWLSPLELRLELVPRVPLEPQPSLRPVVQLERVRPLPRARRLVPGPPVQQAQAQPVLLGLRLRLVLAVRRARAPRAGYRALLLSLQRLVLAQQALLERPPLRERPRQLEPVRRVRPGHRLLLRLVMRLVQALPALKRRHRVQRPEQGLRLVLVHPWLARRALQQVQARLQLRRLGKARQQARGPLLRRQLVKALRRGQAVPLRLVWSLRQALALHPGRARPLRSVLGNRLAARQAQAPRTVSVLRRHWLRLQRVERARLPVWVPRPPRRLRVQQEPGPLPLLAAQLHPRRPVRAGQAQRVPWAPLRLGLLHLRPARAQRRHRQLGRVQRAEAGLPRRLVDRRSRQPAARPARVQRLHKLRVRVQRAGLAWGVGLVRRPFLRLAVRVGQERQVALVLRHRTRQRICTMASKGDDNGKYWRHD